MAIAAEGEGLPLHPLELLVLYEARSIVVHGAERNVCGKRDYEQLRTVAIDATKQVAALASSDPTVTRISKLIDTLHAESNLRRAIAWLEKTSNLETKEFQQLVKYAKGFLTSCTSTSVDRNCMSQGARISFYLNGDP